MQRIIALLSDAYYSNLLQRTLLKPTVHAQGRAARARRILMRNPFLVIPLIAAFTGCQETRQFTAVPPPSVQSNQHSGTTPSTPSTALPPVPQPLVKVVTHEEPVVTPVSDTERLPQSPQQPDTSNALTLTNLEQMALAANPSVSRAEALVRAARGNGKCEY